jgi:cytochrome P450
MPLLNALINVSPCVPRFFVDLPENFIQEVLRMYCGFPLSERVATEDCILPLSQPLTTTTGIQISEIPIKKGQCLYVAIAAYHRCGMTVCRY